MLLHVNFQLQVIFFRLSLFPWWSFFPFLLMLDLPSAVRFKPPTHQGDFPSALKTEQIPFQSPHLCPLPVSLTQENAQLLSSAPHPPLLSLCGLLLSRLFELDQYQRTEIFSPDPSCFSSCVYQSGKLVDSFQARQVSVYSGWDARPPFSNPSCFKGPDHCLMIVWWFYTSAFVQHVVRPCLKAVIEREEKQRMLQMGIM